MITLGKAAAKNSSFLPLKNPQNQSAISSMFCFCNNPKRKKKQPSLFNLPNFKVSQDFVMNQLQI